MSNDDRVIVDKLRQLGVKQLREVRNWLEDQKRRAKEAKNEQKFVG